MASRDITLLAPPSLSTIGDVAVLAAILPEPTVVRAGVPTLTLVLWRMGVLLNIEKTTDLRIGDKGFPLGMLRRNANGSQMSPNRTATAVAADLEGT